MKIAILAFLISWHLSSLGQTWKVVEKPGKKQIDILFNGKLMTSYCYYDSVMKPVLFPINTLSGITITRGFPIAPREGDHPDHPHHTGLWMNYESVNGIDFWNNSSAIAFNKKSLYGRIIHKKTTSSGASGKSATLETESDWVTKDGTTLLHEKTSFTFRQAKTDFIIDRTAVLTAQNQEVYFKDVKDGFLGLRVASELEQPSAEPLEFIDAHGNATKVEGGGKLATGLYTSSAGLTGDAVWGTRGTWTTLQGTKDGRPISITIIDHPSNPGYPTYWHARGYGLFAANPLGQAIFSQGKNTLGFKLAPHQSVTFRYRIVIAETEADLQHINAVADEFSK